MSLSREVTIWCDGCLEWVQGQPTATIIRRHLKTLGWTRVKVNGEMKDYCPKCSKERVQE